jgi:hypothetical protein
MMELFFFHMGIVVLVIGTGTGEMSGRGLVPIVGVQ